VAGHDGDIFVRRAGIEQGIPQFFFQFQSMELYGRSKCTPMSDE
jgi:hypothetical protein